MSQTASQTPPPLLEVANLHFRYRDAAAEVLRDVTLTLRAGEFTALVGASGAGKTTLCRCVNRIIPTFHKGDLRGRIRLRGESIAGKTIRQLVPGIGMVFQDFETQLFSTNVATEVAFGLENLGVPRAEIHRRVAEMLALVGLSAQADREPATLSGGQKQRLAIAAVLAMTPELLILDEPTTDLDPAARVEIMRLAEGLRQARTAVLLVDHELDDLPASADRIVVLADGTPALDGPAGAILRQPRELERLGVRPPQIADFFQRAGAADLPLTVADGRDYCRSLGWHVNAEKTKELAHPPVRHETEPILAVRDVAFTYPNGVAALQNVNLEIYPGEIVALLGQNGCGKTTLARLLNGLLTPTTGEVRLHGRPLTALKLSEVGRHIGYVFQNPDHQIFAQTVRQEVEFGPKNLGIPAAELPARLARTLAAVGLQGREDDNPFAMSKGERQRIAVASILAAEPQVIILDEPTTGLDYRQQVEMMALVRRLHAAGHTILLITHAMWVAAEHAGRCVLMADGRIIADGPTRVVFQDDALLAAASLRAPAITRLGQALGCAALSVDELLSVMERG